MRLRSRFASVVLDRYQTWGVEELLERVVFALSTSPSETRMHHILIAPPANGNIGDQAMVEAYLKGVNGSVVVVSQATGSLVISGPLTAARHVVLKNLVYGRNPLRHLRDIRAFAKLCNNALSLSVVGADMMDGAYNTSAAVRRSVLLGLASNSGLDSRLLGFSWSANPHRRAQESLRRAGRAGARLMVRDPCSYERLASAAIPGTELISDIVFSDRELDESAYSEVKGALRGRPFVVLNASGLIQKRLMQNDDYAFLVDYFVASGMHCVLLPHVLRSTADDLVVCRSIHDEANARGVHTVLIDKQLTPSQVRGICAHAHGVVTGRMHLAVMALGQGVPAFVLSTQGKVEGLAQMLGQKDISITPAAGFSRQVETALGANPINEFSERKKLLGRVMPGIRDRSLENFDGLRNSE